MSADGYFRVPRRLAAAQISPERVAALLWMVSQASYAPREVDGVALEIGETPSIAASEFERRYKWTRKATRVFLDYALSDRCAEETGIRIRIGKKSKGPSEGPALGPSKGPTYLVRLHSVKASQGPSEGPALGPSKGPPLVEGKKKVENKYKHPPTGDDAIASDETAHSVQGGLVVPAVNGQGMTTGILIGAWLRWRTEHGFPRPSQQEIGKQGAFAGRICRDHSPEHIMAAFAGIQTLTPHGEPFNQPWDLGTLCEKFTRARDNAMNHPKVQEARDKANLDAMLEGL